MSGHPLIVLKFGGSVLTDETTLRRAVHEIYRWRRDGYGVVAVVSALSGVTDSLFQRCKRFGAGPASHAVAAVVSTGELQAAGLLGLHLDRAGIAASVMSPATVRLVADGPALDAAPIDMGTSAVHRALERGSVVVVAGYVAEDVQGRPVVLGRGGSDLTALFIARRLGADRCRLVKDVDGLYERDPALPGPPARRYAAACWADALATDGSIVQHKAVRFAKRHGIEFELGGFNTCAATRIGHGPAELHERRPPARRLRTVLLGLGTVGVGVYELLLQLEPLIELVSIAVRDTSKLRGLDLSDTVLTDDPRKAVASGADVVIELMGGVGDARSAVEDAIRSGAHVVTANKTLIAEHGRSLIELGRSNGSLLRYSAAAGGSMPLLERLRRHASRPVRSVRAILNGTTNFVLDAVADGRGFAEAVRDAQGRGLAEADPSRDLDGRDAADKLCLVAAELGVGPITPADVHREPLSAGTVAARMASVSNGGVVRHVATLRCDGPQPIAEIRLVPLDENDVLAGIRSEHNAAVIEAVDGGTESVHGKGAGRWPTAEAVIADVLEIARMEQA